MSAMLPDRTVRGRRPVWRNVPLAAGDPRAAWEGLLRARGLREDDPFFTPRLADLPDPDGMQDMARASERLAAAVRAGERVHVFGDFDADGVCGAAILVEALRAAGAQVSCSIPHRVDQGHGIGVEAVREAVAAGARVGVSVDTGTVCFDACAAARDLGMDLIVTDHHLPEADRLPEAFALLNPARADCGFAGRLLCGTGVAFFLLMSLWRRLGEAGGRPDFDLRALLDRVAIATIADVMDLTGVNRILVHAGLKRMREAPSPGVAALMRIARVRRVDVEAIAFHLAPRINAAGRMRHGEEALALLGCDDPARADALAAALDAANRERRGIEAQVTREAEAMLAERSEAALAAWHPDWHAGVVGLAAGRLARKHGRPAAIGFDAGEGRVRVSLRGAPGFHVGDLLRECAEVLEGFGGHAGAGGGTVRAHAWDDFVRAFAEAVAKQAAGGATHLELPVDGVLAPAAHHAALARRLRRFEPVGRGNPACLWMLPPLRVQRHRALKGGVARLLLGEPADQGGVQVNAVVFGAGGLGEAIGEGRWLRAIGRLELDEWRGGDAVQFVIEDACIADGNNGKA